MKKLLYTIASLAALTAIACTKEQGTPEVRPEIPDTPEEVIEVPATLSGSMGDPTTKVSNDNNGAYKWQASDRVTILTDNGANREFSAEEAGLTTEFSGHIPNTDALVGGFALYPASEDHSVSGTTITFNIPTTLTWGADASYMPMYAPIGEDPEDAQKVKASFKAVGGAMKLICYNIPAGATTLAFTAKVNIAGNFTLDTTAGTPTLSGEESGKEIDIDFTGNYSANKVFYIPLPPVTLTGGFTITIFDSEATKLYEKTTTAAPAIGRNHLVIAPALNCNPAPADDELTNAAIVASEDLTNSYSSGTIGDWSFNACKQTYNTVVYIQIRSNSTVSYIKVPEYSNEIASVVLHDVRNGSGGAYANTIYFRSSASNSATPIASADPTLSPGDDYELSIPEGHTTGYIMSSNPLRCASITVKFRGTDITAPAITVGSNELTINVGSSNASTTASLANAVDGLGINWKFSGTNADKFEASLDGTTLTVTAKETNSSASDYTAILTLKASGATSKEIAITQKTKLVPNPAVTVTPGDSKFTATWTADENATSYVAYLHTAQTATPATVGTDITSSISNSGSAYSITDYPVTNGTTYYLYVKVNGINSGYVAPSEYVEYSFTPAIWDLKSIAVTTAPTKTTYTAGEFFDPTGLVVTPTFEERGNTSNTKVGDPVDNDDLTFTPSTSTALTTSDVSVSISYTVSGITQGTTQAITVNPDTSDHYQKVTSLSNVTAGEYIIVNDGYYLPNADATSAGPSKVSVNISNDEVQSVTSAMTWTFTGTSSEMTIQSKADATKYLNVSGNGNDRIRVNTTSNHTWTIADYSGTSGAFTMKDNSNNRYCATYGAGTDWRSYTSYNASNYGNGGRVYLYKLVDNTVWDLKSIAVTTPPAKTTYDVGDNFDPTGMVVTATYEDHAGVKADKEETVAHGDLTFSPALNAALTAGTTSVSISYGGQSTSQAITVIEWTLNSIAVKTAPTKVTYTAGQNFDPAGLVITATYTAAGQSNKNVDIAYSNETAAAFIFSPTTSTALTTDHSSVSITWGGKTTSQAITVNEAGGSTPLTNPADVKVTAITTSSFTATWSNDASASSYEWMLSTSSTAPASTSDSSVKAYGTSSVATLSSNTWTLNKTSITPALDGKYYFYVKAIGSGSFSDSAYSSAAKVILTLDFSSNIFSLSTSGNDASSETSKAYNNYTYKLYATNSCYWYSSSALFLGKSGSYLTVPAISGVKLTSVTAGNRTGASSKVTVAIVPTNNTTATTGGSASTITPGSSKTWNLTATSENTAYRLYVNNANNVQFTTITLIYTD